MIEVALIGISALFLGAVKAVCYRLLLRAVANSYSEKDKELNLWLVATIRVLLGTALGVILTRFFPSPNGRMPVSLEYYLVVLPVLRCGVWLIVLRVFFDRKFSNRKKTISWAIAGTIYSYFVDALTFFVLLVLGSRLGLLIC